MKTRSVAFQSEKPIAGNRAVGEDILIGNDRRRPVDPRLASFNASCSADSGASEQDATGSAFPAFAKDIAKTAPQLILGNGGPVMKNAQLVTITFEADDPANVQTIEKFSDTISASEYWKNGVGEYGVGAMRSDPSLHFHITQGDMPPTRS